MPSNGTIMVVLVTTILMGWVAVLAYGASIRRDAKAARAGNRIVSADMPAILHSGEYESTWMGLSYDPDRPWTVTMYIIDPGAAVTWEIAREHLAGGMSTPNDEEYEWGRIEVRPTSRDAGHGWFDVVVDNGTEGGVLSLPKDQVREFLQQTYRHVPAGLEKRSLKDTSQAEYVGIDEILDER